jgi:hypothetical protein
MRNYKTDEDRRAAKKITIWAWGLGAFFAAGTVFGWTFISGADAVLLGVFGVAGIACSVLSYRSVMGKN